MSTGDPCQRCGAVQCQCAQSPFYAMLGPPRLHDDDIDRIAERVIAKLTAPYEPPKAKEPT